MVLDPRRRQKKLERRKAKQKAKSALARRDPRDLQFRLERCSSAPILHCCVNALLWEQGMGNLLVSRELGGKVAYVVFLVDAYCLGVKDVAMNVVSRSEYDWQVHAKLTARGAVVDLTPACARKLVEGAVEYSLDLGLPPHSDYRRARLIFGDIDAGPCTDDFQYGRDGKPCFISGPNDTPARCRQIIDRLKERLGPEGFETILVLKAGTVR